tara:strand:+ start:365 stop:1153 length:789 start_codon:yes stop_codon:yes gene_type:complete
MSIQVHKTGLVKTLGQQSDAIVTSNLIGNFNPSSIGSDANAWDNLVTNGKNLRRYNGITHNNSAPHNFQFDGTDDYLGAASTGYGGDPFNVNIGNAFTILVWFKHNNVTSYPCNVKVDNNNRFYLQVQSDEDVRLWIEAGGSDRFWTMDEFRSLISANTWYYIGVSHDGSGKWKVYLNGSFLFSTYDTPFDTDAGNLMDPTGSGPLEIGRRNVSSAAYSGSGTKVGHVHVYDAQLTDSQIRQNFLASHDINDNRIYGPTYTA